MPAKILNTALFQKGSQILTYLRYFRTLFDTREATLERLKAFRSVDYSDGLLIKLGSKETVSSTIFDP